MSDEKNFALTRLYHPQGPQVSIPIDVATGISPEGATNLLISVSNLLTAGWMVNAPGLEDGELLEEVSAISRRTGADDTPIIDFYSSNTRLAKKFMHVYLNGPEDITAFENATGIPVPSVITYDGKTAIERTDRNAAKYILQLARPIKLVWKLSPKWEQWKQAGGEGQEPHKRLLVRYEAGPALAVEAGSRISESGSEVTAPSAVMQQYNKRDGTLVNLLVKKTGLKPTVIMPILMKVPGDTISFESALKLITTQPLTES